jgi:hypothetical protein
MAGLTILLGSACFLAGVMAWTGIWRSWTRLPFIGTSVFALIPGGLAIMLMPIGWAFLLVVVALFSFAFALNIWVPKALEPRWYRETIRRCPGT